MKQMALSIAMIVALAATHSVDGFSIRSNHSSLRASAEPAGCVSSKGLHICNCCNFRYDAWNEGRCNNWQHGEGTPCAECCTKPTGEPKCSGKEDYLKVMVDGDTTNIYTSVGGVLYHIPTCDFCGGSWCSPPTQKAIPSSCAEQPDGNMNTGEWMSKHQAFCPPSECEGFADYQKLMIDGDTRNIYTSVGGKLYHIPTCSACGQSWCGSRATQRTIPSSCANQPDGNANTNAWMAAHRVTCEDGSRPDPVTCTCETPNAGASGHNKYKCSDGTSGYCSSKDACFTDQSFIKGKWEDGCQVTCSCSTPNRGTAGHNQYKCTDGGVGYCSAHHACYATKPFVKGKWGDGCRAP